MVPLLVNHASRYALDDACQYAGRDFAVSTQDVVPAMRTATWPFLTESPKYS